MMQDKIHWPVECYAIFPYCDHSLRYKNYNENYSILYSQVCAEKMNLTLKTKKK